MLEFLLPILYPEKPIWMTVVIGNTIFGALSEEQKIDWAKIIFGMIHHLVSNVGKSRGTPICLFLFHLYKKQGLLTSNEAIE